MSSSYMGNAMLRIAAMEEEALSGSDAAPFWPYSQESFPYWTNRPAARSTDDWSEDIQVYRRQVLARLVIGHLESGYKGENADKLIDWMADIETYWREHPMLTTDAGSYTSEPDYLFEEMRNLTDTGLVVFQNSGLMSTQIGVEYTLDIPFLRSVY